MCLQKVGFPKWRNWEKKGKYVAIENWPSCDKEMAKSSWPRTIITALLLVCANDTTISWEKVGKNRDEFYLWP